MVETGDTIRTTGKKFGVARSTVYRDITERLSEIDKELAKRALEVLKYHKTVRHIREGEAIKQKYTSNKNKCIHSNSLNKYISSAKN